jgi:mycofactocin system glycosyltransferase
LPAGYRLVLDRRSVELDDGRTLMGGSPFRLMRLSDRAKAMVEGWKSGSVVGNERVEQLLARRLVRAGIFVPHPPSPSFGVADVTVVVPVKDRPEMLARLITSLGDVSCVIVDDGSARPEAIEAIARAAGAAYLALNPSRGPAGARNAGLDLVRTPLVAFVDSDCTPQDDWLVPLLGHFEDPIVACVAPRVRTSSPEGSDWLARYEAVRSSLDRGAHAGLVRPLSAIPFVPSAALVLRSQTATANRFDEALLGGEDVDLVWRLVEAGWDVRYEPSSTVIHDQQRSTGEWLARRAFYGSTAGPLALRHPSAIAPFVASAWSVATWLLVLRRRPVLAAGTLGVSILVLAHRLGDSVSHPVPVAARIAGGGTLRSTMPALSGIVRAWSPAFVLGLAFPRYRRASAIALLAPALEDLRTNPGDLDPLRYISAHVADDIAYGIGVWRGSVRSRTLRPLWPRVVVRSRIWSKAALNPLRRAPATKPSTVCD